MAFFFSLPLLTNKHNAGSKILFKCLNINGFHRSHKNFPRKILIPLQSVNAPNNFHVRILHTQQSRVLKNNKQLERTYTHTHLLPT